MLNLTSNKLMQENFSEMTDSCWQFVEKIIDNKRERHHSLRTMVNAIFWINNTGSQWRNMESKYPPWQTVYYHFRQFKLRGIWEELLDRLAIEERKRQEKNDTPSLLAIDSQSVKCVQFIGADTGTDGGKKINAGPPVRPQENDPSRYAWHPLGGESDIRRIVRQPGGYSGT